MGVGGVDNGTRVFTTQIQEVCLSSEETAPWQLFRTTGDSRGIHP